MLFLVLMWLCETMIPLTIASNCNASHTLIAMNKQCDTLTHSADHVFVQLSYEIILKH